jgi:hypothetical protein
MVGSFILKMISLVTIRGKLVHFGEKSTLLKHTILKSKNGLFLYFLNDFIDDNLW